MPPVSDFIKVYGKKLLPYEDEIVALANDGVPDNAIRAYLKIYIPDSLYEFDDKYSGFYPDHVAFCMDECQREDGKLKPWHWSSTVFPYVKWKALWKDHFQHEFKFARVDGMNYYFWSPM